MSNQMSKVHETQQKSAIGREIQPGVNWVWYVTDNKDDAVAWFQELTGSDPVYDWVICEVDPGRFGFRLRH